ncbi:molybdopterin-dependent oxidoreductase [Halococcus saccharolyticus]|uniref:Sulfite oxidase-like oxidoreductase n=1 Tax=Halococcus saccharolyticus DSM 5350 TaxID=1227455 RepID=M0MCC1_9EURY|nr:molybdopterin-dependent oxidoreductase [Halococcus saccharolyticus]EMA43417.1 sulfite oxidase-like oxidoreductase [Halococcus saccharolyticus DSM 5350]
MARNILDESIGAALVTAVLAGIAGVAGSYALAGFTPAFLASPITSFLTAVMPSAVLQFAIVTLTDVGQAFGIEHLGQQANLLLALTLGAGLLGSLALAALATGHRLDSPAAAVSLAGLGAWLATAVLTGAPIPSLGAGVGSAVVVGVATATLVTADDGTAESGVSRGRRTMLGSLASALGVGVIGYVLGGRDTGSAQEASLSSVTNGSSDANGTGGAIGADSDAGNDTNGGADGGGSDTVEEGNSSADAQPKSTDDLLADAEAASFAIEGLEELVSGDDFYVVDTANPNPDVNADDWTLSITGAVDGEHTFDYDEITSMGSEHRFMTLRCVSDPRNGNKMDNALWTGVPMERVLDGVDLQGKFVMARSVDGYYEEFPVEALRTGFLAYGMDGEVLPRAHGYPVRALIPGHWGEINVKWIDELEILDRPAKGFWEKKGWKGTGPVHTVAKLHATNRADGRITVAGHANAGVQGIERVEVSTDGGSSWNDAELSPVLTPNLGGDVWRQWRYDYDEPGEQHEVVVRAVDGTGTLQPKKETGRFPSGSMGWVSKTIEK